VGRNFGLGCACLIRLARRRPLARNVAKVAAAGDQLDQIPDNVIPMPPYFFIDKGAEITSITAEFTVYVLSVESRKDGAANLHCDSGVAINRRTNEVIYWINSHESGE
jgi:hypothetical protein